MYVSVYVCTVWRSGAVCASWFSPSTMWFWESNLGLVSLDWIRLGGKHLYLITISPGLSVLFFTHNKENLLCMHWLLVSKLWLERTSLQWVRAEVKQCGEERGNGMEIMSTWVFCQYTYFPDILGGSPTKSSLSRHHSKTKGHTESMFEVTL